LVKRILKFLSILLPILREGEECYFFSNLKGVECFLLQVWDGVSFSQTLSERTVIFPNLKSGECNRKPWVWYIRF